MSYWVAGSIIVSAAASYASAEKAEDAQHAAMQSAKKDARKQLAQAEEEANAQNMKSPDTQAMMSSAMLSGKAGQSGTLLTGPQGVERDKLGLQRKTLLGQ